MLSRSSIDHQISDHNDRFLPPGAVLFPPFPSARRAGWTLHLLAHDYRSPARQLAAKRVNTIEMLLAREAGNNEDVVGRTMGVDALLSNRFPDFPIPICDSRFFAPPVSLASGLFLETILRCRCVAMDRRYPYSPPPPSLSLTVISRCRWYEGKGMKDEGEGETWIGKEGRKRLFRTLRDAIHAPCNKIQEEGGGGRDRSIDPSMGAYIHR